MGRFWLVTVVAVGLVALTACGPPPSVDTGRGSGSAEPSPCPAERTQPPPVGQRVFPEEKMAARQEGISVEKFQRQEALGDEVGRLAAALRKNEPDTYAELELDYGQKFRVIVYSTGDGEETVLPYARCTPLEGHVEVRTIEASIAELEAAQDEAYRIVTEDLGIPSARTRTSTSRSTGPRSTSPTRNAWRQPCASRAKSCPSTWRSWRSAGWPNRISELRRTSSARSSQNNPSTRSGE